MAPESSFHQLIDRLQSGDGDAARQLFHHFAYRLIALARSRLSSRLQQKLDAEDVVQSAFRSFFLGHAAGRFHLVGWDSLWGLLASITIRKCVDKAEHYGAARRDLTRELSSAAQPNSAPADGQMLSRDPTPEEAACLTETVEQLLKGLAPREHDMVVFALQGYSIPEISERVGRSERSVYRILSHVRKRLERLRDATTT